MSEKNKITIVIDNCCHCPSACLKRERESGEAIMYCQQPRSLMMLREGWGSRPIPNWCPRLAREEAEIKNNMVRSKGRTKNEG